MLEPVHIAVILLGVIAFAAFSRRIEMSVVTMPMVFTTFGWLVGRGGVQLVPMEIEHRLIHTVAEVTLILVLFTDASQVKIDALRKNYALPARMLLIGMPLTIAFGTMIALWVSPMAGWAGALLVAAILTPTDAALAQAVVSNPETPERLRQGVNVESGLNDGLALPVVMVAAFAAAAGAGLTVEGAPENLATFILLQLTLGPAVGVAIGVGAARLLDFAIAKELATTVYQGIYFLCTAFLCYVVAEIVGGNGLSPPLSGASVSGLASNVRGRSSPNSWRARAGF